MYSNGLYDIFNQYSVDNLRRFNENSSNYNIDLLNNLKYQSSHNMLSGLFAPNNLYSAYSLNNINFNKTESDFGKEKNIKLNEVDINNNINLNNINNNFLNYSHNNIINNNINNNNIGTDYNNLNNKSNNNINYNNSLRNSQFNIIYNENNNNLSYGDYFLNASNYNNILLQNKLKLNVINPNNNIMNKINNNNNTNLFNNNYFLNFDYNNNNLNKEANNNQNININNIIINNIAFNNKETENEKNKNEKDGGISINIETDKNNNEIKKDKENKNSKNELIQNVGQEVGDTEKPKKRRRRKKNFTNKIIQIIKYGHPKSIIYKTMKQKLNIHKKFDLECRNDSLLLIHTISKLKLIIKKLISKKKIKNKSQIQILKDFYRNSILSIQHREYAQDITGYKLI